MLSLSLIVCSAAAEASYTARVGERELFTVTYDDSLLTMDDETYSGDSTDDFEWFMILSSQDFAIDCGASRYSEDENESLYLMAQDAQDEYLKSFSAGSAPSSLSFIETYPVSAGGVSVPFVVTSYSDAEYGDSYIAFTILGGYEIYFEAYGADGENTDAILSALKTLIDSFVPAA